MPVFNGGDETLLENIGNMSLKLTKQPGRTNWYLRGTIKGTRVTESTGTSVKMLAEEYRVQREHELYREAIYGAKVDATFRDAAKRYLSAGGDDRFLAPVLSRIGDVPIARIRQQEVDDLARALFKGKSSATANRQVYTPVSSVLHHAAGLGWCPVPVLRRPKQPASRVRYITAEEAGRLLDAAQPYMRPLICFLLYTGARVGEALWLDWSAVDLKRRHVEFVKTKNGSARGVPLHMAVVRELEGLAHRNGSVFRRSDGQPYTKPTVRHDTSAGARIRSSFATAVRRAGLTDFHPHDCRHTWATWHYQANRDLGALMRLGGWKTMSMVMRYAHTNVDELSHTIDSLWEVA